MTDKPNVPLPPGHVDPLTTTWSAGHRLYRVHTARWAEVIHRSNDIVDGIIWVSRQFDTAKALLAFGDRLNQDDFAVIGAPELLDRGQGYRRAQEAASAAGITIVEG